MDIDKWTDERCGCGGKLRYSHFIDGEEVMSCNKYAVCMSYDEQREKIMRLTTETVKYRHALNRIVQWDGEDYEYKAWAKEALEHNAK